MRFLVKKRQVVPQPRQLCANRIGLRVEYSQSARCELLLVYGPGSHTDPETCVKSVPTLATGLAWVGPLGAAAEQATVFGHHLADPDALIVDRELSQLVGMRRCTYFNHRHYTQQ